MINLLPKDTRFFDLWEAIAHHVVQSAVHLQTLIKEHPKIDGPLQLVRNEEHEADKLAHEALDRLDRTFITPFDREDIYTLAGSLDDIMDYLEEAVDLVVLYNVEELPKGVEQQIEVLARAAELTAEAMPNLRTMSNLTEYWIEVNRLENQADQIHRKLLAQLFNGKYDAIEVLKLKQIVDVLEEAADAFEHVANTVETIAVKES